MFWKYAAVMSLCVLMFLLGFFCGGFQLAWADKGHSEIVALWSMLGGWVSGLATLAAVAVSMWMAFHATQADVEKIEITTSGIDKSPFGETYTMNIRIKNLKNVKAKITDLSLFIPEKSLSVSLNFMFGQRLNEDSAVLKEKGDHLDLPLVIESNMKWASIFISLRDDPELKFEKLRLKIFTALKTYDIDLPEALTTCVKGRFDAWGQQNPHLLGDKSGDELF
ncbi:hypothetical protein [Enterobacter asburiae]|uniref:hypothetical protein n=1 Tax=Enterobacter asburiae TaxID=61645 RepID=UPI0006683C84|nr:hypothetical protein [Enterobacter asburiae]NIH44242.1 hypothetical protein [Enterobacter asburiae]